MASLKHVAGIDRIAAAIAVVFSLLLASVPLAGAACAESTPVASPLVENCGGCCAVISCCEDPADTVPLSAIPGSGQNEALHALLALSISTRPVLAVLAPEKPYRVSQWQLLYGSPSDAPAILCVFLI